MGTARKRFIGDNYQGAEEFGRSDDAFADVKLMLYLTDSMKNEPFLISYLVRIACLQLAIQPVWEGLAEHAWSDAQLQALQASFQQYDFFTPMEQSLASERAAGILTADLLARGKYHLNDLTEDPSHAGSALANLAGWIDPHGWYYLRSDNGSEFIARIVQQWLAQNHIKTIYIEPGSPWQNGFVESFHGRFRDECLNREQLWTLTEARVVIGDYRCKYNQHGPHSRLGYLSPARFAAQLSPSPAPVGLRPPSAGDGQNQNQKLT